MDVATYLAEICENLAKYRTTSRRLAALEFEAEGRDIMVLSRPGLHRADYPPLDAILTEIGRTCLQDGIDTSQLRRIVFLDSEIRVELFDEAGQQKLYRYPIGSANRNDAVHAPERA